MATEIGVGAIAAHLNHAAGQAKEKFSVAGAVWLVWGLWEAGRNVAAGGLAGRLLLRPHWPKALLFWRWQQLVRPGPALRRTRQCRR